jgi:hypothetical protein
MRCLASLLTLVVLLGLAACDRKPAAPPPGLAQGQRPEAFNQVVVLTADRLVVDGKKVQLANAVAPDVLPGARCWSEAIAAKQGRRVVKDLFFAATRIEVSDTGRRDADGRSIALVRLDGVDLGENLLQLGLATRPSAKRFDWCAPVSTRMADGPSLAALGDLSP